MRKLILSIVTLITLFIVGCGPAMSLHPLYTDEDVVFIPALVGRWGKGDNNDDWIFQKSKNNAYSVTAIISSKDTFALEGRLLQLDNHMFMDVMSRESDIENFLAVPVHVFLRLSLEGDSLGIAYMDDSWLKENIEQKSIEIKHELTDDSNILLTASTKELQQFVLKHAEDKKAFDLEYCYRRN